MRRLEKGLQVVVEIMVVDNGRVDLVSAGFSVS